MVAGKKVDLSLPPMSILGKKKTPGDAKKLADFILENAVGFDNAIISTETLIYGGLIPSRLHHHMLEELIARLETLKKLKELNPKIRIYASNCVMRTPQYNSDDEEPSYYLEYGYAMFRRRYLMDYKARHGLTPEEEAELNGYVIPAEHIADYETRRDKNTAVSLELLTYLEKGIVDFLIVPQDDAALYGYTALSQKRVIDSVREKRLQTKVMIYPGADESGLTMLARAYNEHHGLEPKIYPFYSSQLGPSIIPKYEDRPMHETLKSHVRACRARLVATPSESDIILAVNSPGKFMEDAYDRVFDVTHYTWRNVLDFVMQINDYANDGHKVAVCDSVLCNGGDVQLLTNMDELNVLEKVISYAGWNTNANTLGTTLAQAFVGNEINMHNLAFRIIEDVLYQSDVRHIVTEVDLKNMGISEKDVPVHADEIKKHIKKRLQEAYDNLVFSKKYPVEIDVTLPWERLFEIGLQIKQK